MGTRQQSLIEFLRHFKETISRRVHDRRLQTRLQVGASIALGIGLLISMALAFSLLNFPRQGIADLFYQSIKPSDQVVIIAIDNPSLNQLGEWPWRRATLAKLIDLIVDAQPRGIALDILLSEPSNDDEILAASLQRAPWVIQPIIGAEALRSFAANSPIPRYDAALTPAPSLRTVNTVLANAMISPDDDGIVRHISPIIQVGEQRYLTFGIATLAATTGQLLTPNTENNTIVFGSLSLPVNAQGQMRINFSNDHKIISASDVIQGRISSASLKDKIILIGLLNSTADQDLKTPLVLGTHPTWPIEIHADIIHMILGNYLLSDQDRFSEVLIIFIIALMVGATLPHVRVLTAVGLTMIYVLMYISYAIHQFTAGILVKPIYPILAIILTAVLTILYQYFSEERHLDALRRLFHVYVSPELIDQVLRASYSGTLPLGGMRRQVSVLYIDLRDLTEIAPNLNAEAMIKLLNKYIKLIGAAIFRHEGFIVKRSGDTIVAVWNLPLDQKDFGIRAVRTALDIWREFSEIQHDQLKELNVAIGIGVATGRVTAGRIDTSKQGEFILVGEVVGMAERMAIKPDRGVYIDSETRQQIGDAYETYQANPIRLRRRTDPVDVWLLVDPAEMQRQADAEAEKIQEMQKASPS